MSLRAEAPSIREPGWAMTARAYQALLADAARLAAEVARHDGYVTVRPGGDRGAPSMLPNVAGQRLLGELRNARTALAGAHIEADPHVAVVGRAVTIREPDGHETTYTLVIPGDGEGSRRLVAVDSPVGRALYGCRVGDVVEITAPAGAWTATVTDIA